MYSRSLVVLSSILSLVHALSISPSCQSAVASVTFSQESSCLNLLGLGAGLFFTSSNVSLVPSIDSWTQSVCSQPICTNQTLADVAGKITSNCSSDIPQALLSSNLVKDVQQFYPDFHELLCLKDQTSDQTCITKILSDVENATGLLTRSRLLAEIIAIKLSGGAALSVPPDVLGSECMQAFSRAFDTPSTSDKSGTKPSKRN